MYKLTISTSFDWINWYPCLFLSKQKDVAYPFNQSFLCKLNSKLRCCKIEYNVELENHLIILYTKIVILRLIILKSYDLYLHKMFIFISRWHSFQNWKILPITSFWSNLTKTRRRNLKVKWTRFVKRRYRKAKSTNLNHLHHFRLKSVSHDGDNLFKSQIGNQFKLVPFWK